MHFERLHLGSSSRSPLGEKRFTFNNHDDHPTGWAACIVPLPPSLVKMHYIACILLAATKATKERRRLTSAVILPCPQVAISRGNLIRILRTLL